MESPRPASHATVSSPMVDSALPVSHDIVYSPMVYSPSSASRSTFSSPMVMSPMSASSVFTTGPVPDYGSMVLALGILRGSVAEVEALIRLGATISERHHWTLYHACLLGCDMIKALLASPQISFNICAPVDGGDTVLHLVLRTPSARFGSSKLRIVDLLSQYGADALQQDRLGESALHILASMPDEDTQILQSVIFGFGPMPHVNAHHDEDALQPNGFDGTGPRILASIPEEGSYSGSNPMPHVNDQNVYGDTALIVAVMCGHLEAARLLLGVGADPNIRGENGMVAMQYAIQQSHLEMLALLQDFGAEVC